MGSSPPAFRFPERHSFLFNNKQPLARSYVHWKSILALMEL
uniref:Uncharacterized protein n=1 Tax=Anguilla anguilla TaxID=7936 RepID=A0A0E9V1K8_ANGAN